MFVYRSLSLGLLGACCLLLAMQPSISISSGCPGQVVLVSSGDRPTNPTPTLVDVAAGVTREQLSRLLVLSPGEQIAAIDDVPVATPIEAGMKLASIELGAKHYIDLEIAGPSGARRMLVLLH